MPYVHKRLEKFFACKVFSISSMLEESGRNIYSPVPFWRTAELENISI